MAHSLETQTPVVALATPVGVSALAVIRLSGKDCHKLVFPLLRLKSVTSPEHLAKYYTKMLRCDVVWPASAGKPLQFVDDGMCVFFKAPATYTGEDLVEVYVHGGSYVVCRCLELFLAHGFREALPGEFTYRAFFHGKMDLTAAEGVQALTGADCEHEWQAALHLVKGTLAKHVVSLRSKMVKARAWLEASMDFPEEQDTQEIGKAELRAALTQIQESLAELSSTFRSGQVASAGFKVVLCGRTNAGKSTLHNILTSSDRSIVTDIEGTTRDYVDSVVILSGRKFRFFDTAGLRMPLEVGKVEHLGIKKTLELMKTADLLCLLVPASDKEPLNIESFFEAYGVVPPTTLSVMRLISQSDKELRRPEWGAQEDISISCPSAEEYVGIDTLQAALVSLVDRATADIGKKVFITKPRHQAACQLAIRSLESVLEKEREGAYEEILAHELKAAFYHLGSIIGDVSDDDVLDVIFKDFCLGK